jgi:sugar/nucleoside kinase (ribokinase family)
MLVGLGSIALDTTRTPFKTVTEVLGGSGSYFSLTSSLFTETGLIAVIGDDFPEKYRKLFESKIDTKGLEVDKGKTFRFDSSFGYDLGARTTNKTELNVFGSWQPSIPDEYKDADYLYLGNVGPDQQLNVIDQMKAPKLTVADTISFWITTQLENLKEVVSKVDGMVLNDQEVRQLSESSNIYKGARKLIDWGTKFVIVKKGEHGATLFTKDIVFPTCSYPLENVVDPTGAGDSFAGGFMGHIARRDSLDMKTLREAIVYGNIMGSFIVQDFSIGSLMGLTLEEVERRYKDYREIISY